MMQAEWALSLRDQSVEAGAAFFMKQMTAKAPKQGEALIPPDLLIHQWPEAA